ncbi:MAG: PorV/PorQ family protein [candidate division KSB1 bacterium]|nr:PorV/PorQ family protein [candidate division KSB1 bacterium]
MKIKLIILLILTTVSIGQAQWDYGFDFNKAGTAGLQFLKIGVGAKESAMGEAALGVSKGANAIFWNPAGIAYAAQREVTFSYNKWLLDITHSATAITMQVKNIGTIGLSLLYMGVPEFQETTVQAQDGTGRMVSAYDLGIGLAVARRFTDKLAMGGQIRYVKEQLDHDSFSNVLLDIGAIYFTGFRHLNISVCAQHFGPDIKMLRDKFRMPLAFKVGLADDLIHFEDQRLTLAIDLVHPTDNTERMNFGLEYGFFNWLFLRGGYRLNADLGNWSFGAGLQQSLIGVNGSIDYSFSDYGQIMGGVNRLTVTFGF